MSDWTNLEEIMQDLSVAQGYVVPAALETYAAVGPPPLNIEEEESEERSYYESLAGGGGDFVMPDYELIQQMLNMVKDDPEDDNPTLTSDLDLHTPESVQQDLKKKISRNVALSSIITAKEAKRPVSNDIIPIMFKKKASNNTEVRREKVSASQTSSPEKLKQYTPSSQACEYYSKYLENSKLNKQFEEDIWLRAERQMKELDDRKKRKVELLIPQDQRNMSPQVVASVTYDVNLSEHRHLMPGDCIVCAVAAKHGYYF